ncbi:hypothetical protein NPIL_222311 [Nephila pilipes]|uniref:C2H2-type domain-containing protein n=1 Tax=Nephila pilipes TaxID=299642 RepID=A0A8X6PBG3_NEPPI|nr:hypothetical protein NPIL_222311 [Nephila pilipes]
MICASPTWDVICQRWFPTTDDAGNVTKAREKRTRYTIPAKILGIVRYRKCLLSPKQYLEHLRIGYSIKYPYRMECSYCKQRYESARELSIHEFLHSDNNIEEFHVFKVRGLPQKKIRMFEKYSGVDEKLDFPYRLPLFIPVVRNNHSISKMEFPYCKQK